MIASLLVTIGIILLIAWGIVQIFPQSYRYVRVVTIILIVLVVLSAFGYLPVGLIR